MSRRRTLFPSTVWILQAGLLLFFAGLTACSDKPVTRMDLQASVAEVDTSARQLTLTLDPSDARLFAELTANNVGRVLELSVDGVSVMRPVIREAIVGREIRVTWNEDEAGQRLASMISERPSVHLTLSVVE